MKTLHESTKLTNYASTQWTNADQLSTGPQTAFYKLDAARRVTAMADAGTIEFHGNEKITMPTQTRTADLSIMATPRKLEGYLLSGAATISTSSMSIGVESTKMLDDESIGGIITIGDGFDGAMSEFTENYA